MLTTISQDVVDFLHNNHVGVLATASSSGMPHAAAVFYTTDSKMNLYFLTKENTTKSRNLSANPLAAMVIYDASLLRTAQVIGSVDKVKDKELMEKALRVMSRFSKKVADTEVTPISKLDAGEYILYRLIPQSIRLGDYKYGTRSTIFDVATPAEESLEPKDK